MLRCTRFACAAVLLELFAAGDSRAQGRAISITEALTIAARSHPDILAAQSDLAISRGDVVSARAWLNPELTVFSGPATNRDTSLTTGQFTLAQTVELGGKRGARVTAARRRADAADARLERQRSLVSLNVQRAFRLALIARTRVSVALDADSVGAALARAADERLQLGAGTQLEVNVAAAAAARDRRARLVAEQGLTRALFDLHAAIGLPPADSIVPSGVPPDPVLPTATEDALVQVALRRSDLIALEHEREAAERDLALARALTWPDPTVGVGGGRAEDFRVRLLTLTLPLPLWNRGSGARASATAALDQTSTRLLAAQRSAEREVRVAYRALERALESTRAFDVQVVERLRENLDLANESFQSGKISLFAYTTLRRDLVAARLDYLDALADVAEREYALAVATGESRGGSR
jgi:cobalt-zinc-cadmium efflux system outer membrane protein